MNTKTRIGLIIVLSMILLLTMTIPTLAKKPDPVSMTMTITHVVPGSWPIFGEGTFEAFQPINDQGNAVAEWWWGPNGRFIQTTITLFGDIEGNNIVINMITEFPEEGEPCVTGTWRVIDGTGDYENLRGVGDAEVCAENPGETIPFTVQFDGNVH